MVNTTTNAFSSHSAGRVLWIDYLRTFITILVVAHHASLAYTTFAHFNKEVYILSSAPVVDHRRCLALDIFENFNDVFFMALMFLIGGVFVVKSLQKKGTVRFVKDRFYRLFLPFLCAVSTLMLLAYYPSLHLAKPQATVSDFIVDFFTVEAWPPGPPWFIWVLFLFNFLVALTGESGLLLIKRAGSQLQTLAARPTYAVTLFFLLTWLLYVPASWIWGAYTWTGIGPFDFQKSRLLLYFAFFLFGCMIGYPDPDQGLFASGSAFMRKWPFWVSGCVFFYGLLVFIQLLFPHGTGSGGLGARTDQFIYSTIYTLSTCFSSLACLSLFRKFVTRPLKIWDSLSSNAYCIYLVHYIFVVWIQYFLLNVPVPAIVKFVICFVLSLVISWMVSIALRKITVIKNYV